MNPTQVIIRRARRRTVIARMVDRAGRGALYGLIATIPVLALDRILGLHQPWWVFALIAGIGIVAGTVSALIRLPDPVQVAATIDRALNLKDRIGTAAALRVPASGIGSGPTHDDEFSRLATRDAEQWAARIDVRSVTPIEVTDVWRLVVVLAAVIAGGFLFIPSASWGASSLTPEQLAAQREATEEQRQQLAGAIEEARDTLPRDLAGDDPDLQENLDALDRLAAQLDPNAAQVPAPEEINAARDEAAARMNDVADTLAERAERDAASLNDLTNRFAGMKNDREAPMTAEQFANALKRGEYGDAADLLEQMLADRESMTEQERADAAEFVRDLSDQLDAMSESDRNTLEERAEQLRQALRDQGLTDEEIDRLNDTTPPEDVEEQLRESGVDEQVARDIAEDLQDQREREKTQDRTDARSDALSESFDRAADELETPPAPPTPPTTPDRDTPPTDDDLQTPPRDADTNQQDDSNDAADTQDTDSSNSAEQKSGEQQQTGEQQTGNEQKTGEQQQTGEQKSGEQQQTGTEQKTGQQQTQDGDQQTGERQQTGEQQTGEQQQSGEQRTGGEQQTVDPQTGEQQQTGEQRTGEQQTVDQQSGSDQQAGEQAAKPGETGETGAQPDQAGEQGTQQSDPTDSGEQTFDPNADPKPGERDGEQPMPTKDDLEKFREWAKENPGAVDRLRKMAEQMQGTEEGREQADKMRQRARELMESMSDEERREWAEQWQQQMGEQSEEEGPRGNADRESSAGDGSGAGTQPDNSIRDGDRSNAIPPPPTQSETIDVTGETVEGETIAEWLDDTPPGDDTTGNASARTVNTRLREARRVAERAVDDSAVPQRYHDFIKRYFQRLNESAKPADDPPSAPPAGDANEQSGGADGS